MKTVYPDFPSCSNSCSQEKSKNIKKQNISNVEIDIGGYSDNSVACDNLSEMLSLALTDYEEKQKKKNR